jgi:tetratricopeptide (TPR) repeat protein
MQTAHTPSSSQLVELEAELQQLQALIEQRRFDQVVSVTGQRLLEFPGHRDLLYQRAVALRLQMKIPEALATLETLEDASPAYPRLFQERGLCYVGLRQAPEAIQALERAVAINPALPASWRTLQKLYGMVGRRRDSDTASQHVAKLAALPVEVVTARSMLADGNLGDAEATIRGFLQRAPDDIEAMRVLAMIAHQNEVSKDAVVLLEAVLAKAPDYHAARQDLVLALTAVHKHARAQEHLEILMTAQPDNTSHRRMLASILLPQGQAEKSISLYRQLIGESPTDPDLHLQFGHALKTQGLRVEGEQEYREASRLRPGFGDAYWSLANLKTYRFTDVELATMRDQVEARRITLPDRYQLCFALGKGLEDRGEYAESFKFYERGNALKKAESRYKLELIERTAEQQMELFTREFFGVRRNWGYEDPAPIFIVGLPRAGSTLLEQILASHSRVEGTMELADIPRLVASLDQHPSSARFPAAIAQLTAEDCRAFGEGFLRDTLDYRVAKKPFFIDKMPNNFRYVGLIHLMLPNAKIIDARREPMACCFSNFKQLFASGQQFTYSLDDIGRYYRLYVRLMEHWDSVLPGKVLRVQHEDVIDDLDGSVRRILDYCGLEFEPACVEFHKTERRVHTASSEQVRRPINREGVDQWRNFEPWLKPLRDALGPLAET